MIVNQLKPNQVQRGLDLPEPVEVHSQQNPAAELSIRGVEKTNESGRLCRLNLPVHGLECEIKHGGGANCELRSANDEWSFHE